MHGSVQREQGRHGSHFFVTEFVETERSNESEIAGEV